jgi:hypothetical protein
MDDTGPASVRRPGAVPDDTVGGVDTDGDGVPDTVLVGDGADLLVRTDLDADGLVDRVLRIGVDAVVRVEPLSAEADGPDEAFGSAPATWPGFLGRLFGPDP